MFRHNKEFQAPRWLAFGTSPGTRVIFADARARNIARGSSAFSPQGISPVLVNALSRLKFVAFSLAHLMLLLFAREGRRRAALQARNFPAPKASFSIGIGGNVSVDVDRNDDFENGPPTKWPKGVFYRKRNVECSLCHPKSLFVHANFTFCFGAHQGKSPSEEVFEGTYFAIQNDL